jgi:hypothetical protein
MKPRKLWSALKPSTRLRKLRFYRKQGLTPAQVARRYNTGSLGSQAAVRGHAETPEHGLGQALKEPGKYRKYLRKRERPGGGRETPEDEAIRINNQLDRAFTNFDRRLSHYVYYNRRTVRANVYGGETSESGIVPGMSYAQATWTASADTEEIRSMASEQYRGNPWWYH